MHSDFQYPPPPPLRSCLDVSFGAVLGDVDYHRPFPLQECRLPSTLLHQPARNRIAPPLSRLRLVTSLRNYAIKVLPKDIPRGPYKPHHYC